jgi:uncharacterized damage-inducible protein DinB
MLSDLLRYEQWADRRTLDAVAAIDVHRFASAMAFARQQLNHMVRVEELFRARLLGWPDPHSTTNCDSVPELEELDRRLSMSNEWLRSYATSLDASGRAESIRFHFVDGKRGTLSREEVLFHLINHGTYHRGAIGHALNLAEAHRPPDTYAVFIHVVEPTRRDEV